MEDLTGLLGKVENKGETPQGKLSAPMGVGVKGAVGFGYLEGVDLKAVAFLDKEGNPCEVNFILIEDEERN